MSALGWMVIGAAVAAALAVVTIVVVALVNPAFWRGR